MAGIVMAMYTRNNLSDEAAELMSGVWLSGFWFLTHERSAGGFFAALEATRASAGSLLCCRSPFDEVAHSLCQEHTSALRSSRRHLCSSTWACPSQ
eukprot:4799849-Prymnesium_polylepis.2